MPELLALVVEAMRIHSGAVEVQARGASCVALLAPLVPFAALSAVAPTAIVAVLKGFRRFNRMDVMAGAAAALRAFCEVCRRHRGGETTKAGNAIDRALKMLRAHEKTSKNMKKSIKKVDEMR